MIDECCRVLGDRGIFVGYFPTIFSPLEMTYLEPAAEFLRTSGAISLPRSMFQFSRSGLRQIYYTPLRLAQIFHDDGFHLKKMEIVFFDGSDIQEQSEQLFGIPRESGLYPWELLVVMQKIG